MFKYKVAVLGSAGVGKSTLTVQFVEDTSLGLYDPDIDNLCRKNVEVDGKRVLLEIDDVTNIEINEMRDLYMRNAQGFVLVYSISARSTFEYLQELREEILTMRRTTGNVPMILVGNKLDLEGERAVSREQGMELARSFHCAFIETSAKAKLNVNEVFYDLVREIFKNHKRINKQPRKIYYCKPICVIL